MNRLYYYSFLFCHYLFLISLKTIALFVRIKKPNNSIAALPYYPSSWPGGKDRIAAWKSHFEDENIQFDVYPCWTEDDILFYFKCQREKNEWGRYKVFRKIFLSRIQLLFKLRNYETVWIQRAFIPMFPFKDAYYERLLKKIHPNVIYDFYDADYESNHNLVFNTVKEAQAVTVASLFLKDKFSSYNKNIHFIRYAIDISQFLPHETQTDDLIKIGWMGSPENAKQLVLIADQLRKIEEEHQNVQFSFVCRELPDLGLKRSLNLKWGDEGFDYYQWLSNLDLGLVPFIDQTDRTEAKISMKSLEFMAAGVSQVSSPWVHSDQMRSGESILIADSDEWYSKINYMIVNDYERNLFGRKSKDIYAYYHDFPAVYKSLKEVLINS